MERPTPVLMETSLYNNSLATDPNTLVTQGVIISVITVTSLVLVGFVLNKFIRLMMGKN